MRGAGPVSRLAVEGERVVEPPGGFGETSLAEGETAVVEEDLGFGRPVAELVIEVEGAAETGFVGGEIPFGLGDRSEVVEGARGGVLAADPQEDVERLLELRLGFL